MRHSKFAVGVISGVALAAAMGWSIFTATAQSTFGGPVMTVTTITGAGASAQIAAANSSRRLIQICITGSANGGWIAPSVHSVVGDLDFGGDVLHVSGVAGFARSGRRWRQWRGMVRHSRRNARDVHRVGMVMNVRLRAGSYGSLLAVAVVAGWHAKMGGAFNRVLCPIALPAESYPLHTRSFGWGRPARLGLPFDHMVVGSAL